MLGEKNSIFSRKYVGRQTRNRKFAGTVSASSKIVHLDVNLYPATGRFLRRVSFKFSPKTLFDTLNSILESGFDFHVSSSSLCSTNVPMWERWQHDDENLPDFENIQQTTQ